MQQTENQKSCFEMEFGIEYFEMQFGVEYVPKSNIK